MISILCTLGVIGALFFGLAIGYHWGYRKGEASGFDRAERVQVPPFKPMSSEYHAKFDRYQCSRKFFVRSSWDVEDLELASTSHVKLMSESIAQLLIDNRVIRPYVVSREPERDGEVWNIGVSLYCAKDPVSEDYDSLPFIRLNPLQWE